VILNVLVLLAIAVVAVFGALERVYRATLMLVALILAGALACVLAGPATDLFGFSGRAAGTWSYTADAFCFWAILCVAFLALRAAGQRLLPNEPPLPTTAHVVGGAAIGVVAGYLAVGLCLVIVQMLPVAPSVLGYEPFRYVEGVSHKNPQRVERAGALWLVPDRAAVWFFDAVTGGALDPAGGALLARYGDAYPPERLRPAAYEPVVNTDDFLYYHWYRRWQAIRWRTGRVLGPIPEVPPGTEGRHGLMLERARKTTLYGMELEVYFAVRSDKVAGFPRVKAPPGQEFLKVRLRMKPASHLPRTIDSAQFCLVDASGHRVAGDPLVTGDARKGSEDGDGPEAVGSAASPPTVPRNLRFAFPGGGDWGVYVCTGMRFRFRQPRQYESRILVFTVPTPLPTDALRLFMDARVPPLDEVNQEAWPDEPPS